MIIRLTVLGLHSQCVWDREAEHQVNEDDIVSSSFIVNKSSSSVQFRTKILMPIGLMLLFAASFP